MTTRKIKAVRYAGEHYLMPDVRDRLQALLDKAQRLDVPQGEREQMLDAFCAIKPLLTIEWKPPVGRKVRIGDILFIHHGTEPKPTHVVKGPGHYDGFVIVENIESGLTYNHDVRYGYSVREPDGSWVPATGYEEAQP